MSEPTKPSLLDRFERRFILATSRGLFVTIAVLAAFALFGGGAVFAYALTPSLRGFDPAEIEPPAPPEVTLAEVMATLDAPEEQGDFEEDGGPSFVAAELNAGSDMATAETSEFTEMATRLSSYFDTAAYPWLSETKLTCTYFNRFTGCLNWENKTIRKGIVELINEAFLKQPQGEHVAILRALVAIMPLCADEDTRFVAVGAVLDMVTAAGTVDVGELTAFQAMLTLKPAEGSTTPLLLPAATAQEYMRAVLRARKRGAKPALVSAWLVAIPQLYTTFTPGIEGQTLQVDGVVAAWQALQGTIPELAPQRIEGIRVIAASAPAGRQIEVVRAYGDLMRERATSAQRDYERAVAERAVAIAQLDVELEAKQEMKSGLRAVSTSVVGTAFSLIAGVGLLLALLAVERNTRTLRDMLARMPVGPLPTPASQGAPGSLAAPNAPPEA